MIKRLLVCAGILCATITLSLEAKTPHLLQAAQSPEMEHWVDSVFNTLSPKARIGQLIVATVRNSDTPQNRNALKLLVQNQKIGGLLFDSGTVKDQANLTNYCQSLADVPLLITLDGEWGLAMRLSNTPRFPVNMTLGAIQNDSLLYEYGRAVGRQCRRMGVQVNFAPVLDVNSNPQNPVIGKRSFGESVENVSSKAIAYAKGLETEGIMAVGKHFPGHGDTSEDSHKTLPLIPHSRSRLMSVEIPPFQAFTNSGLSGAMVGHLNIPALDPSGTPASLSPNIVQEILRDSLRFEGLVFTDALKMQGVVNHGNTVLKSLIAGNDIALNPANIESQLNAVLAAISNGKISQQFIDDKCKKVLRYKYLLGLNRYQPISLQNLTRDLNAPEHESLIRQLYRESLTLLCDKQQLIPFKGLGQKRIAVVSIGDDSQSAFQKTISLYIGNTARFSDQTPIPQLIDTLRHYDHVIVAIHSHKAAHRAHIERVCQTGKAIAVCFLTPYQMGKLGHELADCQALLLAYEDTDRAQENAAQALFGGCAIRGKLPVSLKGFYQLGDGLTTSKTRLGYTTPESVGMDSRILARMDSIVAKGIAHKAFPGGQLVVARNGEVIWNKSYGYFDYETKQHAVTDNDIYDLASISKATGTLPALMKAYDKGLLDLSKPLAHYVAALRNTDKTEITLQEALFHETGMPSILPMAQVLIDSASFTAPLFKRRRDAVYSILVDNHTYAHRNARLRPELVSTQHSEKYPLRIAHDLYGATYLPDTLLNRIAHIKLHPTKKSRYSCLNFILLKEAIEQVTHTPMDEYLQQHIFAPLGMTATGYNPLDRFPSKRIAPTEHDKLYRKQTLVGYTHDETAAFFGGVQGNAGLFSNANDLAKLCQMWLNGGNYGGEEILSSKTVELFMTTQSPNSRRGLGFDKPDIQEPDRSPTALEASPSTVGHLGFTGGCFWIDPESELIYIFLCNRVYPSRTYKELFSLNTRPELLSTIYRSINHYSK